MNGPMLFQLGNVRLADLQSQAERARAIRAARAARPRPTAPWRRFFAQGCGTGPWLRSLVRDQRRPGLPADYAR